MNEKEFMNLSKYDEGWVDAIQYLGNEANFNRWGHSQEEWEQLIHDIQEELLLKAPKDVETYIRKSWEV